MAVGGHQVVEEREDHPVLIITTQEHQGLKPVGTLWGSGTAPRCIQCSLASVEPNCGGVRKGRPQGHLPGTGAHPLAPTHTNMQHNTEPSHMLAQSPADSELTEAAIPGLEK